MTGRRSDQSTTRLPGDPDDPHDGREWRERYSIWWTSGERDCHPPCWEVGPCCTCEKREVGPMEDWDYEVCSDYRYWYYVFECDCDCPELSCWNGCMHTVEPVQVEMDSAGGTAWPDPPRSASTGLDSNTPFAAVLGRYQQTNATLELYTYI